MPDGILTRVPHEIARKQKKKKTDGGRGGDSRESDSRLESFQACQESEGSATQKQPTWKPSTPITRYFPL